VKYFKINPQKIDPKIVKVAAETIKNGGIIVYPTDTLYGLGVDITNAVALDKLFYLKQREDDKPISVLINNISQAEDIAGPLSEQEKKISELFFPGKITLLCDVKKEVNIPRLQRQKKIGFRIPDYSLCSKLIEEAGNPISTTSVNISKNKNVRSVQEVIGIFGDKIDLILDGGEIKSDKGSTIIDAGSVPPVILREGDISRREIEEKLGVKVSTNYSGKFVITFVCSGNICRSPMAAGILKQILSRTKYKNIVEINSAGTLKMITSPASLNAIEVSSKFDINLSEHLSKHIQTEMVREANIIICMALNHYNYITRKYTAFKYKTILLKQWKIKHQLMNPSIADPIGHDMQFYKQTFTEIHDEIMRIFPALISEIKKYAKNYSINI